MLLVLQLISCFYITAIKVFLTCQKKLLLQINVIMNCTNEHGRKYCFNSVFWYYVTIITIVLWKRHKT